MVNVADALKKAQEGKATTGMGIDESGGTIISSAYDLASKIIKADYPVSNWNIYCFHYSDGDNWSETDNNKSIEIIKNHLLPVSNMIGYVQINSPGGSGEFSDVLAAAFPDEKRIILSLIDNKEDIIDSIKTLLGKGY